MQLVIETQTKVTTLHSGLKDNMIIRQSENNQIDSVVKLSKEEAIKIARAILNDYNVTL